MTEQLHFHFSLSCIGEGNGNPLQYSRLENPRDGGACWAAVFGVAQSRTRLNRLSSSSRSSLPTSQAQVCERPRANEVITLFSLALHSRHNSIRRQLNLSNPDFNIQQLQKQEQLTGIGRIKPELYKQRSLDNDDGRRSNSKSCGKLNFILKYDCDLEQLIVKIHKAVNLPAKDFSGTSDPYVKIYLLPDRKTKHQTKVHRKTLNPVFDEVFLFPVPYNDLAARKLHFSVYDFDRFSRHDLIGQVVVDHFLDLADFPRECILWKDIEYVTNVSLTFLHFG